MTDFNANEIKQRTRAAVQDGLLKAGRLVADESLKKVPRDTGRLAESIYIRPGGEGFSIEVGYSAGYAAAVHKNAEDKFLTQPFCDAEESIKGILKTSVEEAVR